MKRKIFLIILVFLFNIIWVNAISVTNNLASKYNFVIKTNSQTNLSNNHLVEDLDIMLRTDLSYDNEDASVIANKINMYLKTEMENKGEVISKYAIASEVNPYLVAAMILEESRCDSECSFLVKRCNNVGRMYYDKDNMGEVACYGGSYQKFDSLDNSIRAYIKYINTNFYSKDLTTPTSIAKEYKRDLRWVFRVNQFMEKIKNATV